MVYDVIARLGRMRISSDWTKTKKQENKLDFEDETFEVLRFRGFEVPGASQGADEDGQTGLNSFAFKREPRMKLDRSAFPAGAWA